MDRSTPRAIARSLSTRYRATASRWVTSVRRVVGCGLRGVIHSGERDGVAAVLLWQQRDHGGVGEQSDDRFDIHEDAMGAARVLLDGGRSNGTSQPFLFSMMAFASPKYPRR